MRFSTVFEILLIVVVGVAASQSAAFIAAYEQNLSGRADELQRDVADLEARAEEGGRTVADHVSYLRNHEDPTVASEGDALIAKWTRATRLIGVNADLVEAEFWERPLVFARGFDRDVALDTWRGFSPSIPINGHGLIYAAIAILAVLLVYRLIALVLGAVLFRGRRRQAAGT